MNILAVGSIAYDSIKTPFASGKGVLGGSLTYFSLAAKYFSRVSIVGVVGQDFKRQHLNLLRKHGINLSGLKIANGKTFRWSGIYNYDLNNRETLSTQLNVFKNFNPLISPRHQNIKTVFLGNIDPVLQLQVLKQIKSPKLVVVDTMNYWIEKKRKILRRVLRQTDILIINESEARQLAGQYNLSKAAGLIVDQMEATRRAGKATLLIKQGEYGLLMFHRRGWFSLPAIPLERVFDPTGAGDSFAGGFVGCLASQKTVTDRALKKAALYGTIMASFAVEKLGPFGLTSLSRAKINTRLNALRLITRI